MIQHKYIMSSVQNRCKYVALAIVYCISNKLILILQTSRRIIVPITHNSNDSFRSYSDPDKNDEYIWLSVGISMRPFLSATSVSIRRPVPLLLVVQSRDCQLLLVPQKCKTTFSQMLHIISCHNRYLKSCLISKIASRSMITQNKTVAEKSRCKHFCRERVPPSWANTNGHNSNGLRTVMLGGSPYKQPSHSPWWLSPYQLIEQPCHTQGGPLTKPYQNLWLCNEVKPTGQ